MLSQCLRGKECSIHQLLWVYIENFNMQKQKLALLKSIGFCLQLKHRFLENGFKIGSKSFPIIVVHS